MPGVLHPALAGAPCWSATLPRTAAVGVWLAWWRWVCWRWGVAACSVRDAKAEASASASASASAAIARAEKGIADANASATASREAALTPELRAKRDAALAEPAPAKPPQLNEESAGGRSQPASATSSTSTATPS